MYFWHNNLNNGTKNGHTVLEIPKSDIATLNILQKYWWSKLKVASCWLEDIKFGMDLGLLHMQEKKSEYTVKYEPKIDDFSFNQELMHAWSQFHMTMVYVCLKNHRAALNCTFLANSNADFIRVSVRKQSLRVRTTTKIVIIIWNKWANKPNN